MTNDISGLNKTQLLELAESTSLTNALVNDIFNQKENSHKFVAIGLQMSGKDNQRHKMLVCSGLDVTIDGKFEEYHPKAIDASCYGVGNSAIAFSIGNFGALAIDWGKIAKTAKYPVKWRIGEVSSWVINSDGTIEADFVEVTNAEGEVTSPMLYDIRVDGIKDDESPDNPAHSKVGKEVVNQFAKSIGVEIPKGGFGAGSYNANSINSLLDQFNNGDLDAAEFAAKMAELRAAKEK